MLTILLTIQVIITVFLIAVIMIQKSEGGGLGIGGSGGGMGDFLGAKGTANLLTRVTAILAAIFMMLSIVLAILSSNINKDNSSIIDTIVAQEEQNIEVEEVKKEEVVVEEGLTPEMQAIKDSVHKSMNKDVEEEK